MVHGSAGCDENDELSVQRRGVRFAFPAGARCDMYTRFPAYAFPLVGLMLLGSLACNSSVAPTSPDATSSPVSVSLKAEPNALQAEMLHDNGCTVFDRLASA
jgi:hypothetical protein